MPKKRVPSDDPWVVSSAEELKAMCELMCDIALRGPHEESLMLQVANKGGIQHVTDTIKKRRVMRSKFSKAGRSSEDDNGAQKPRKRKKAQSAGGESTSAA